MYMFLQVLDDGRFDDGQDVLVSFQDAIIIKTSNAGIGKSKPCWFRGSSRRTNLFSVSSNFSPEFKNRFEGIIEFKSLAINSFRLIYASRYISALLAQHSFDVTDMSRKKLLSTWP